MSVPLTIGQMTFYYMVNINICFLFDVFRYPKEIVCFLQNHVANKQMCKYLHHHFVIYIYTNVKTMTFKKFLQCLGFMFKSSPTSTFYVLQDNKYARRGQICIKDQQRILWRPLT